MSEFSFLSPWLLLHLHCFDVFLTGLLQLFFIECSNNFFSIDITTDAHPSHSIFLLSWSQKLLQTNLVCSFFGKIFLYFDILTWSPTLKLGSLLLCLTSYSICVLGLTSIDFTFIDPRYVLLYLSIISSSLWIYTFFCTAVICFWILLFKVLINFPAIADFPSLYVECILMPLSSGHDFIDPF